MVVQEKRVRSKFLIMVAVTTLILGLLGPRTHAEKTSPYKIGDKVENFTLRDERGKKVSLSRFKNKIVVLAFYGSW
jgi:cytochrome oxidase Cu insertion factor (SCO1/SenC/PrrC family)